MNNCKQAYEKGDLLIENDKIKEIGIRCALARSTMDCGEGLPETWIESTEYTLNKQIEAFEK